MNRIVLFLLAATAMAIASCASVKSTVASPEAMAGIKTIYLKDETDPVLRAASNAYVIKDLIIIALDGKGYHVCQSACGEDAAAVVVVKDFRSTMSFNPMTRVTVPNTVIGFTFKLTGKNGDVLIDTKANKKSDMPHRDAAVKMVQDMAAAIPGAQK